MLVTNVSITDPPVEFYLAHATNEILTITTNGFAFSPTNSMGDGAVEADFVISRTGGATFTTALTVPYTISGTASNGVDSCHHFKFGLDPFLPD